MTYTAEPRMNTPQRNTEWLRREAQLSLTQVRHLFRSDPSLLRCGDIESVVGPRLAWLRGTLGLSRDRVSARACLLTLDVDDQLAPTLNWLTQVARLPLSSVRSNSRLLRQSVEKQLAPALRFLLEEARMPLAKVATWPDVLATRIEETLRPSFCFLTEVIGVPRERVYSNLHLLANKVCHLTSVVRWLVGVAGLSLEKVGRYPALLGCNLKSNLEPTYRWLATKVGLAPVPPGLLGYNLPDMKRRWGQASPSPEWDRTAKLRVLYLRTNPDRPPTKGEDPVVPFKRVPFRRQGGGAREVRRRERLARGLSRGRETHLSQ